MTRQKPRQSAATARPLDPKPAPRPSEPTESPPVPAGGWLFTDYAMI